MDQPTPKVTRADVERVVRREFPAERYEAVMGLLAEYGDESWHREVPRVHLAVSKLASGDLDVLRREIETAKTDYRDVLCSAEYPAYSRCLHPARLGAAERRKIIDEDWRQCERWLKG